MLSILLSPVGGCHSRPVLWVVALRLVESHNASKLARLHVTARFVSSSSV